MASKVPSREELQLMYFHCYPLMLMYGFPVIPNDMMFEYATPQKWFSILKSFMELVSIACGFTNAYTTAMNDVHFPEILHTTELFSFLLSKLSDKEMKDVLPRLFGSLEKTSQKGGGKYANPFQAYLQSGGAIMKLADLQDYLRPKGYEVIVAETNTYPKDIFFKIRSGRHTDKFPDNPTYAAGITEQQEIYFYNIGTKVTSWDLPPPLNTRPAPPAPPASRSANGPAEELNDDEGPTAAAAPAAATPAAAAAPRRLAGDSPEGSFVAVPNSGAGVGFELMPAPQGPRARASQQQPNPEALVLAAALQHRGQGAADRRGTLVNRAAGGELTAVPALFGRGAEQAGQIIAQGNIKDVLALAGQGGELSTREVGRSLARLQEQLHTEIDKIRDKSDNISKINNTTSGDTIITRLGITEISQSTKNFLSAMISSLSSYDRQGIFKDVRRARADVARDKRRLASKCISIGATVVIAFGTWHYLTRENDKQPAPAGPAAGSAAARGETVKGWAAWALGGVWDFTSHATGFHDLKTGISNGIGGAVSAVKAAVSVAAVGALTYGAGSLGFTIYEANRNIKNAETRLKDFNNELRKELINALCEEYKAIVAATATKLHLMSITPNTAVATRIYISSLGEEGLEQLIYDEFRRNFLQGKSLITLTRYLPDDRVDSINDFYRTLTESVSSDLKGVTGRISGEIKSGMKMARDVASVTVSAATSVASSIGSAALSFSGMAAKAAVTGGVGGGARRVTRKGRRSGHKGFKKSQSRRRR